MRLRALETESGTILVLDRVPEEVAEGIAEANRPVVSPNYEFLVFLDEVELG